jgi:hypothetical protein
MKELTLDEMREVNGGMPDCHLSLDGCKGDICCISVRCDGKP